MRIAIVGKMRAGKDTVADIIIQKFHYPKYAFADGITEIIQKYFPEALQGEKPRKHYQHIGQELRELNPYVWINYLDRRIEGYNNVIVTDCRQVNEAHYLKEAGFTIIKVIADDDIRIERIKASGGTVSAEQFNHDTEKQVDLIEADYTIFNNGSLESLEEQIDNFFIQDYLRRLNQ